MFSFARTMKRQRPRFRVTTSMPGILYGEDEKAEFLVIDTTISNLSDVANSIVEYGLIIGHPYSLSTEPIHYSENEVGESVFETADMTKKLAVKNTKFDWLETPVNLASHSSANPFNHSSWLASKLLPIQRGAILPANSLNGGVPCLDG